MVQLVGRNANQSRNSSARLSRGQIGIDSMRRDDGGAHRVKLTLQSTGSAIECGHRTRLTGLHKVTGSTLKTTTRTSSAYKYLMLHWRSFIRLLSLLLASSLLTFALRLKASLPI